MSTRCWPHFWLYLSLLSSPRSHYRRSSALTLRIRTCATRRSPLPPRVTSSAPLASSLLWTRHCSLTFSSSAILHRYVHACFDAGGPMICPFDICIIDFLCRASVPQRRTTFTGLMGLRMSLYAARRLALRIARVLWALQGLREHRVSHVSGRRGRSWWLLLQQIYRSREPKSLLVSASGSWRSLFLTAVLLRGRRSSLVA